MFNTSYMSSDGRTFSRRLSTEAPAQITAEWVSGYHPHVFDLIYAFSNINDNLLEVDIPSAYLEPVAVDSARVLGHGASFTASVQQLPPGPSTVQTTVDMGTWTSTKIWQAPLRPKFVVYKTARVAFDAAGDPLPSSRSALNSILTELHALLYPPLWKHPNIIACLGMAWGTNEFNASHRLPALIVEYAEHGTLADVLAKGALTPGLALSFCYDVANALQAIHSAGLIHGDVKAENVLICKGQQRKIAKLADFGYSVVQETELEEIMIGGTWPWRAPESVERIAIEDLSYTDTYSLGLLIWTVSIDGTNPFELIMDDPTKDAIEEMKSFDRLLSASSTAEWMPKYILSMIRKTFQVMQKSTASSTTVKTADVEAAATLTEMIRPLIQILKDVPLLEAEELIRASLIKYVGQHTLYSRLDRIFSLSLGLRPQSRDLSGIVDILRPDVVPAEMHVTRLKIAEPTRTLIKNTGTETRTYGFFPLAHKSRSEQLPVAASESGSSTHDLTTRSQEIRPEAVHDSAGSTALPIREPKGVAERSSDISPQPTIINASRNTSWQRRGYKHSRYSWHAMKEQAPGVQRFAYLALDNMTDAPSRFLLAAALVNGYGCRPNHQRALALLRRCADAGHEPSRAYLYRLHKACNISDVDGYDTSKFLDLMARLGSRAALNDLISSGAGEEAIVSVRWWLTYRTAGVGATWFVDANMLNGLKLGHWLDHDSLVATARTVGDINSYRINKRGDTLLHLTAVQAEHKSRRFLTQDLGADINCRNFAGDTPLISLCRAGIASSAIVFLQTLRADASLSAHNGETALHWLISFQDEVVGPLAKDLVARGARVDAMTTERVGHGRFGASVDVDFLGTGTPLKWAVQCDRPEIVRVLLGLGADIRPEPDGTPSIAVEWAAFFHRAGCLRMMIENLEGNEGGEGDPLWTVVYGPILQRVIYAADGFSMILRNGGRWREALWETLDVVREKGRLSVRPGKFGKQGWTPMYYAIAGGRDEVVKYMVERQWLVGDVNVACGRTMRTPVLEAVRWNRLPLVKLLVENGADVRAKACNPFDDRVRDWSALHIAADEGPSFDTEILDYLVTLGVSVDEVADDSATGDSNADANLAVTDSTPAKGNSNARLGRIRGETALSCALRSNAFDIADALIRLGANPNALSSRAGLYTTESVTTMLGHMIISNARYTYERLKYLLSIEKIQFIVEPTRRLSALHRAALGCTGIMTVSGRAVQRSEFDWDTNHAILRQLVNKFQSQEQLDARCLETEQTALHLAVESGNTGAVVILIEAGANPSTRDSNGDSPSDVLARLRRSDESSAVWKEMVSHLLPLDKEGMSAQA